MKTKQPARTRAQWARHINATHKAVVGTCLSQFLELGRALLAAKKALEHGQFLGMIESDLSFGPRTAQTLMRVAGDKRLAPNAKHASYLPKAVTVLSELTKLSDEEFRQGINAGTINPDMTRKAAKTLSITVTKRDATQAFVAYSFSGKSEPLLPTEPHSVNSEPPEPQTEPLRIVSSGRPEEIEVKVNPIGARASDRTSGLPATGSRAPRRDRDHWPNRNAPH
jgi:hypothetical protein